MSALIVVKDWGKIADGRVRGRAVSNCVRG